MLKQTYEWQKHIDHLVWGSGFSPAFTNVWNSFIKDCSTDVLTTSLLDDYPELADLQAAARHRNTSTWMCLSSIWVCWHSFENLCALLFHLSTVIKTMCFTFVCPLVEDSDLLFVKWSTKSHFGNWFKSFNIVHMKILYHPIIYNDKGCIYIFTTSSMVASGEGTGFVLFCFFLVVAPVHSPGLSERSCTYL